MELINKVYETYKTESKEVQEKYYIDKGKKLSVYALSCGYIQAMESVKTVPYEVFIGTPSFVSTMPEYVIHLAYRGIYTVSFWSKGEYERTQYFDSRKKAEQGYRRLCKYVETLKE